MTITVLVENEARPGLVAEHGLSLLGGYHLRAALPDCRIETPRAGDVIDVSSSIPGP